MWKTGALFELHQTAMDHLLKRTDIDTNRLFVHGCSLGGAVAVSLFTKPQYGAKLCGALLENTFAGISEMVDHLFPLLKPIKQYILQIHWPSRARLEASCPVPILFLSGRQDEVVPCTHMDRLLQAANLGAAAYAQSSSSSSSHALPRPVHTFLEVPNGMHNDTWMKGVVPYFEAAHKFILAQIAARSPAIAAAAGKPESRPWPPAQ